MKAKIVLVAELRLSLILVQALNKINSKKSKNKWDLSVWSLILTSLSIFQYITLFIKIPENEFILFLSFIVGFLALIGQILAIFSLIEIKHGEVPKKNIIYVSLSLLIGIFTIWLPFTIDEIRSFREVTTLPCLTGKG